MATTPFLFKQFTIEQDQCAMKIGTDGVLLGGWLSHVLLEKKVDPNAILDIGTGTGVIALQMAQKFSFAEVDALEVEENAFLQAVENFENSQWADRLFCYYASFQQYVHELHQEQEMPYDIIVSNPPFFTEKTPPSKQKEEKEEKKEDNITENTPRNTARQQENLPLETLLLGSLLLLKPNGYLGIIIPFSQEQDAISIAQKHYIVCQITRVKGTPQTSFKRSLILLQKPTEKQIDSKLTEQTTSIQELIIEKARHQYTTQYTELVKDFYLKM